MPENNSVENAAAEAAKKAADDAKTAADAAAAAAAGDPPADPLKAELEKVQKKGQGRTKREKILYKKELLEQELANLDEEDGITPSIDGDDDTPVTVGMLKEREKKEAQETALSLADDASVVPDENERELIKHHISNTIKPSGNPQQDFKNARAIVNSLKNAQIAEEAGRRSESQRAGSGAGAPAKKGGGIFEPTADELVFMKPPYNLSKDDILAARKKSQAAA